MNVDNHLTVGGHLSGLSVAARDSEVRCTTATDAVPSSTSTAVSVASQPSIHSLAVNVDMYLSNQPSGAYCLFMLGLYHDGHKPRWLQGIP